MRDIPSCKWLDQWTELAQKYEPPPSDFFSSRTNLQNSTRTVQTCVRFFSNCRFAFQYNPSLQPRALVVFGCISKRVSNGQIKQIIRILSKASPLLSIDRVRSVAHNQNYCPFPH